VWRLLLSAVSINQSSVREVEPSGRSGVTKLMVGAVIRGLVTTV
jgi:hypothetical protein